MNLCNIYLCNLLHVLSLKARKLIPEPPIKLQINASYTWEKDEIMLTKSSEDAEKQCFSCGDAGKYKAQHLHMQLLSAIDLNHKV